MSTRTSFRFELAVVLTAYCASAAAGCSDPPYAPSAPTAGGRYALLHEHAGDEALLLFGDHGCGPPPSDPQGDFSRFTMAPVSEQAPAAPRTRRAAR